MTGKQRQPTGDKMMRSPQNKAVIQELTDRAQAALGLLDSETADAIIGEQTDEYRALIQGAHATLGLDWAAMKGAGLRENPATLKAHGQSLMVVTTLVHYAYALGIRRGRGEANG
jgi:hypothetical protein